MPPKRQDTTELRQCKNPECSYVGAIHTFPAIGIQHRKLCRVCYNRYKWLLRQHKKGVDVDLSPYMGKHTWNTTKSRKNGHSGAKKLYYSDTHYTVGNVTLPINPQTFDHVVSILALRGWKAIEVDNA